MYEWTIFCPGPSLNKINRFQYNYWNSIAVNGAILKDFLVQYWAMMDYEVFMTCVNLFTKADFVTIPDNTILWVPDNWPTHMHKWAPNILPAFAKFRCETHPGRNHKETELFDNFPYTKEDIALTILEWSEYTMFNAIALAILKGAKKIRIYGADMIGEGYFRDDLKNDRLNHKKARWEIELMYFNKLKDACAERGIKIIREKT